MSKKQWKKKKRKVLDVQMYCSKELPADFQFQRNPYLAESEDEAQAKQGEEEIARLRKLGVLFYRDEDHTNGAFLEENFQPQDGFYCQFSIAKASGVIAKWWSFNTRVRINWMTKGVVNRDFLEAVKSG